ncbi:MAG: SDR family oxidoreductase [Pseudomonadota bacterium]
MQISSALITGGTSGIGHALAGSLRARGVDVMTTGRRALSEANAASTHVAGDITDPAHRAHLAARLAELRAPRALFHGAGAFQTGRLHTLTSKDWQRSFDINVTARWELSRLAAPLLAGGRILFIGSDAGRNPRNGAAAYSVAQSASETLRMCLQVELAETDIAVTGFKPGLVDTPMVRGFLEASDNAFPARRDYLTYIDNGKLTAPATVARFASWLLCNVETARFRATGWDVRDPDHHDEWLQGPLFLPATKRA